MSLINCKTLLIIFGFSVGIACITLVAERKVGIPWDYHIDSVTYIKNSQTIAHSAKSRIDLMLDHIGLLSDMKLRDIKNILYSEAYVVINAGMTPLKKGQILTTKEYKDLKQYSNPFEAFTGAKAIQTLLLNLDILLYILNNGYFYIVHLLGSDVTVLIAYNIVLFSLTNVLICTIFKKNTCIYFYWGILLLMLNPYRLHLSTTCLKDTTIIFLSVLSVYNLRYFFFTATALLSMRVASAIFFPIFFSNNFRNNIVYFIKKKPFVFLVCSVLSCFGMLILCEFYLDTLINRIISTNNTNMVFRSFDLVPTFCEYGVYGIFLRAILWPFFYLTGLFFFFSPCLEYFSIFLGVICNLIYCKLYIKPRWTVIFAAYLGLGVFALFVSGFTTYLRYSAPILTIIPLLMATQLPSCRPSKVTSP